MIFKRKKTKYTMSEEALLRFGIDCDKVAKSISEIQIVLLKKELNKLKEDNNKPKMCDPQPVQLDCRLVDCINHEGSGVCSHKHPEIVLNPHKTFTCYDYTRKH